MFIERLSPSHSIRVPFKSWASLTVAITFIYDELILVMLNTTVAIWSVWVTTGGPECSPEISDNNCCLEPDVGVQYHSKLPLFTLHL